MFIYRALYPIKKDGLEGTYIYEVAQAHTYQQA